MRAGAAAAAGATPLSMKSKRASVRHQIMDRQMLQAVRGAPGTPATPDPSAGYTPNKMGSLSEE